MAGPWFSEFGSIWKTIREVDIAAIRHEAEHDVVVACVGDRAAVEHMHGLLLGGPDRYPSPYSPRSGSCRSSRCTPASGSSARPTCSWWCCTPT